MNAAPERDCVLLVDDQPMVAEAVRRMLSACEQFEVEYCPSAEQALARALDCRPKVILQDLVMPAHNGLELLRGYRSQRATSDIPVIVLSSNDAADTKADAFSAGACDYMVKLPAPVEFLARLRYHAHACAEHLELQAAIRRLKETQGQLTQAEKMASLGRLAAGIAHEINNPAAFVMSNIERLSETFDVALGMLNTYQALSGDCAVNAAVERYRQDNDWDFRREDLPSIMHESREGLQRIQGIVRELREFTRSGGEQPWQRCDLNVHLRSAIHQFADTLPPSVRLHTGALELPQLLCMPGAIVDALYNLLRNARQAVGDNGRISVTTGTARHLEADSQWCAGTGSAPADDATSWLWIEVRDDGEGIPQANLQKLFEPFFTTREPGQGAGLGLWLVAGTVERHRGLIDIESSPGRGTRMRLWLPLRASKR